MARLSYLAYTVPRLTHIADQILLNTFTHAPSAARTILVTGGAGFIGSHTVARLLVAGHQVRVLDNLSSGCRANLPQGENLVFIEGDIRDAALVRAAMQDVDAVLHLAAQVSVQQSIHSPLDSASSNMTGFLNVLEAVRILKVPRFIYASSAAAYGRPTQLPLLEASFAQPISPYGLEKYVNDEYARLYGELHGISALGLRYFNVYGPRSTANSAYAGVLLKFVVQAKAGRALTVLGDGEQSRDFIHVRDVAEANCRALFSRASGILNIATGVATSLNAVLASLQQVLGAPLEVNYQAAAPGDIQCSYADVARMQAELGSFEFLPLAAGIASLVEAL